MMRRISGAVSAVPSALLNTVGQTFLSALFADIVRQTRMFATLKTLLPSGSVYEKGGWPAEGCRYNR